MARRAQFAHSFVLQCDSEVWDGEACRDVVQLLEQLQSLQLAGANATGSGGPLGQLKPLLCQQHGDLDASKVLVDEHGRVWLCGLEASGEMAPFSDASKLLSVLLFEYI